MPTRRESDISTMDRAVAGGAFFYPSTLLRWGAVFAGAIVAFAFQLLLSTLWVAFAGDTDTGTGIFQDNLNWWIGGTAITAMFIGGFLAGWLSTVRGMVSGLLHGITTWGLVMFAGVFITLPGIQLASIGEQTTWTLFWTFLIGAGTALFGGVLGGSVPQPSAVDGNVVDVREPVRTDNRQRVTAGAGR